MLSLININYFIMHGDKKLLIYHTFLNMINVNFIFIFEFLCTHCHFTYNNECNYRCEEEILHLLSQGIGRAENYIQEQQIFYLKKWQK